MNTQSTHHEGNITFKAAQKINERFIFGAIIDGKITPANKTNRAIAVITDCAQENDYINAQILGSNASTMKVLASSIITANDYITVDNSGKAISFEDQPPGSYQICGIALTNASPGQHVEFTPTLGLKINKSSQ